MKLFKSIVSVILCVLILASLSAPCLALSEPPRTGDNDSLYIWVIVMIVAAVAFCVVLLYGMLTKKK